jgi:Mg-chelatase subunit ChlD
VPRHSQQFGFWSRAGLVLTTLLCAPACGQGDHPAAAAAMEAPATADGFELEVGSETEACVGVSVRAERLPVDLFAVVDGSGSMEEATSTGVSKWHATKAAFNDFLRHAPRGMGFGLSLFPLPGDETASCFTSHYRDAALPIADVSMMIDGALQRLDSVKPAGQTPTGPALTAALELASARALQHPERSVVVVLATDGLPTTCDPVDTAALADLAREALEGPGHVRTLVVASNPLTGGDASGFERIAAAGGTVRPLTIDPRADFASQLGSALGNAADRQVACDLALPELEAGQRLDYDNVNVVLDGVTRSTLARVSGPAACGPAGGWYYDLDPLEGPPSRLNVCKASCERASGLRQLSVELGCRTVVR